MIECDKSNCKQRCIEETHRNLHDIICEHIGYIRTRKLDKATGKHFNFPGHSLSNRKKMILEKKLRSTTHNTVRNVKNTISKNSTCFTEELT